MDTNEQFNKSLYTQSPKKVDLESNVSAFPQEKKYGNSLSVYENQAKKADEQKLSGFYRQRKTDLEDNDSGLYNKSLGTSNSRLVVKNSNNPAASSMYDLKRPQIVRPDRIKRKHQKNATNNITADY